MFLIGIGANLPGPESAPPLQTAQLAAAALDALPGLRVRALSRWFLTDPVPPSGQPPYVNGVALLSGAADPADLLRLLQTIELSFGRVRSVANAARTLDLDIVAIDDVVRAAPDPILPHPRAHLRAFVLRPLLDVAPHWRHPILRQSAHDLLMALPEQGVRPLSPAGRSAF
jgi:2-amino-4-hydroxy-6-hydroxymethyldihydropteridine diphosphokinase